MLKESLICMLSILKKKNTWGRYLQSRGGFFANREGISKQLDLTLLIIQLQMNIPYSEFRDLLTLPEKNGVKTSDMYRNERAGAY